MRVSGCCGAGVLVPQCCRASSIAYFVRETCMPDSAYIVSGLAESVAPVSACARLRSRDCRGSV